MYGDEAHPALEPLRELAFREFDFESLPIHVRMYISMLEIQIVMDEVSDEQFTKTLSEVLDELT